MAQVVDEREPEDGEERDVERDREEGVEGHRQTAVRRASSARTPGVRSTPRLALHDGRNKRDELGVELGAGLALELVERLLDGSGGPVRPVVDDRVVGVDQADDPRPDRDPLAAQAVRIARAVPALVVVAHDRGELRGGRERLADPLADERVEAHLGPLLRA